MHFKAYIVPLYLSSSSSFIFLSFFFFFLFLPSLLPALALNFQISSSFFFSFYSYHILFNYHNTLYLLYPLLNLQGLCCLSQSFWFSKRHSKFLLFFLFCFQIKKQKLTVHKETLANEYLNYFLSLSLLPSSPLYNSA